MAFEHHNQPPTPKKARTLEWQDLNAEPNPELVSRNPWKQPVGHLQPVEISQTTIDEQIEATLSRKLPPSLSPDIVQQKVNNGLDTINYELLQRQDKFFKSFAGQEGSKAIVPIGISKETMMTCIEEELVKACEEYQKQLEGIHVNLKKQVDSQKEELETLTRQLNAFLQCIQENFAALKE